MSDKLDVTIGIAADASGVEAGVNRSKRSLHTLGDTAKSVSKDVGSMGDGSDKAAQKIGRDTKSMERSLQGLLAKLEGGSRESSRYWEKLADMKGVDKNALRPLLDQLDAYNAKQKDATAAAGGFTGALGGMQKALVSAGAAAAAMKFISVADSVTTLGNQLKLATGSIEAASFAYESLFDIAQRSRVGFVALGDTYASIARAAAPLGVSQERLLKVTESIGNAMTISGGSAQGLQAALVQLGQGLSSGVLRGEELNSVMEQAPRLAKALADGLGVTTGQLRAMGAEGEITAEKVIKALESQSGVLKGEVAGATLTVSQSFTQLGNSATFAVGELDKTIGASAAVASAISGIASAIDVVGKAATENEAALKAVLGGGAILVGAKAATVAIGGVTAALTAARVATVGLTAALAANPIGAALVAVTTLGAAAYAASTALNDTGGSVSGIGDAASAAAAQMKTLQVAATEAGAKLTEAEKRLAALEQKGAKGSANLMLREAHADAQRLVNKLREAKRERDKLLRLSDGFTNQLRDGESGNSRGSRANYEKSVFESQQFLAQRNDGVTKQFAADIEGLARAYANGAMSAAEYAKAVTEANQKRYESTEAGKAEAKATAEAAKANKAGESSIISYIKSLEARTAAQRLEIAQGDKLTESQRARIQLETLLADSKTKATAAQVAYAQAQLAEAEANEAWLQNQSEVAKALADMQKAREQSLQSVQDSVRKLVEEAEAAAYAEMNNISLAEAVERLALARAESNYQQAVERQGSQQTLDYLRQEIEARKQLVKATAQKEIKEANKRAAEQAAKDWERVSQTIGDTLADYIMSGGKDASQYLKRLFATLVLQPVVNYGVQGVMGLFGMGSSGSSTAGAFGSISNAASFASFAANAKSYFQVATSFFKGGMSAGNAAGTLYANATGAGIDGLLATNGAYGTGGAGSTSGFGGIGAAWPLAIVAGMLASSKLFDSGYNANNFSGINKLIYGGKTLETGVLSGIVGEKLANILTGAPVMSFVASQFGSRGANHSGGAYSTKGGNAAYQLGLGGDALGDFTSRWNSSIADSLQGLVTTTVDVFDYLKKFNASYSGVDVAAGFATNPVHGDEDAYGYFRVFDKLTGEMLSNYVRRDGGLGSNVQAAWSTYSADLIRAVYGQFKSADITGWVQDELAVLDSAATLENLTAAVQSIAAIDAAFVDFAKTVDGMQDLSGAVQTVLLRVSGGIDALTANVSTYYQNFYSEQERVADTAEQMADALKSYGVALPTTAEQYRSLVEQQLAAGESGAELAAVLLGMSGAFKQVADVWKTELDNLSGGVTSFFGDLQSAISSLVSDVAADRTSIVRGFDAMTKEELQAAIGGISTLGPSLGGVNAAADAVSSTGAQQAAAKSASQAAAKAAADALARANAYRDDPNSATAKAAALASQRDHALSEARKFEDGGMYRSYSYGTRVHWMNYWYPKAQEAQAQLNALQPALDAYNAHLAKLRSEYEAAKLSAEQYAQQLSAADAALKAAQQSELQAKAAYAAEMADWVEAAGTSVGKLSDLRGEVVSFYEAQAQAVQAMVQSAGNLRSVVDAVRMGQLTTAQTAAELGNRYATDYSMALATSGAARAGYVDSMSGNLGSLTEALRAESATGADWRVQTAKLFAQATNAAALLEGDAEAADYESVSLGLLDSIDAKLAELSGIAVDGENLIVQAINQGTYSNLDGLRAIVAALKGEAVPAFAAGGLHAGGLRLVGERGPELEVTGPARYWSTGQTQAMLGGGGSSERVERLLMQLIEEQRVQAARQVDLQLQLNKQVQRWDAMGIPETREVTA